MTIGRLQIINCYWGAYYDHGERVPFSRWLRCVLRVRRMPGSHAFSALGLLFFWRYW
jgi:hypothetical protein